MQNERIEIMGGIFSKPKIPTPPAPAKVKTLPTASDAESRLASQRAIASRMRKSGRMSTALSDEKVGL